MRGGRGAIDTTAVVADAGAAAAGSSCSASPSASSERWGQITALAGDRSPSLDSARRTAGIGGPVGPATPMAPMSTAAAAATAAAPAGSAAGVTGGSPTRKRFAGLAGGRMMELARGRARAWGGLRGTSAISASSRGAAIAQRTRTGLAEQRESDNASRYGCTRRQAHARARTHTHTRARSDARTCARRVSAFRGGEARVPS